MLYISVVFVILGACIGSFLNAAVLRWGIGKSVVFEKDGNEQVRLARSRCPHCSHILSGVELIPIVSFCMQRGRCTQCRKRLGIHYVIIEIISAALGALPWIILWCVKTGRVAPIIFPASEMQAVAIAVFSWVLLLLFIYDLRYQIILDRVSLPAIMVALPTSLLLFERTWESVGLGMLVGGGIFALQFIVSRGKWIGGGDIRLGLCMGALLGFSGTVVALLLTYSIGFIVGLCLLVFGMAQRDTKIPLGTCITIAILLCLYFGELLAHQYLGLIYF